MLRVTLAFLVVLVSGCTVEPSDPFFVGRHFDVGAVDRAVPDGGTIDRAVPDAVEPIPDLTRPRDQSVPPAPIDPRLVATSCAQLNSLLRDQAIAEMDRRLDAWIDHVLAPYFCQSYWGNPDGYFSADAGTPSDLGGAGQYSTTNNQVVSVDEADLLKTDGKHLYIVADGAFQIFDAFPPQTAKRISSTMVEGTPTVLFVHQGRAVVFSSLGGGSRGVTCTYGYDCDFLGDGTPAKLSVFDLADLKSPKLVREIRFSGSYLASRRIDGIVHTLIADLPRSPLDTVAVSYWPSQMDGDESSFRSKHCQGNQLDLPEVQIRHWFEVLRLANRAAIAQAPLKGGMPSAIDTRHVNGKPVVEDPFGACDINLLRSTAGDGNAYLSLVSFDLPADGKLAATSVLSRPGAMFATTEALYVAVRHNSYDTTGWYTGIPGDEASTLHKFRLTVGSTKTTYQGSGVVEGRVLNQFSMDEHKGYLRVATTTGHLPGPTTNQLLILEERAGALVEKGRLGQIGASEDIRSCRLMGDVGYVVTFKKTDPLFVLDLADPAKPTVKGELMVPGFSTYIHPMDATHLMTVGFDADDQGSFAWYTGIRLQIFDVANLAQPKLLYAEVIGTRGSASAAATNHLAFNYFPPKRALALPITVCDGQQWSATKTFDGLYVYDVTTATGFKRLGGIAYGPQSGNCGGSWWSQGTSSVQRSIFMDDYVYAVAPDEIIVGKLPSVSQPVATISLTQ